MKREKYNEAHPESLHATGPLDMSGTYNDPEGGGYDFCRRGILFHFALHPGPAFDAQARLSGGHSDPVNRVEVSRTGSSGEPRLFKEAIPTEPAQKFRSHASASDTYEFGVEVAVSVTVTQNAQGGIEVAVARK